MAKYQRSTATGAAATDMLTDEEQMYIEVLKGTFLEALGEEAIFEIQQRNPKDKVYLQTVEWIKTKWEDCSKSSRNVPENLVKMWNGARTKDTPVLQHWMDIGEKVAQCKLDSMTAQDIEGHIHIAAFISTVNDPKPAKALWERKGTKDGLAEYLRATAEAEKELERIQKKSDKEKPTDKTAETSKVKEKPVGKITRPKPKRHNNNRDGDRDKKNKHFFRCGEANWTPDHAKDCKATCKRCGKIGHFDKYCKSKMTDKKDKKEKVKRIDDSTDTEETYSQSSDSDTNSSDSEESVRQVREILPTHVRKQTEKLTIHAIPPDAEPDNCTALGKSSNSK